MPKLKFLVVEDDLFYQTYVNDLLAETGVDIINASDGEAGLALATSEAPDLIITDIEIPKIQGFVFFKTLRENTVTRDIPVIMMSGKVEKALLDRHAGLSVHAEGYLTKPFSGQVLIDMIRDIIGEDFGFSEVMIDPAPEPPSQQQGSAGDDLPAGPDEEPEISQFPESVPENGQAGGQLTVLVVDDSKYICDITKDFLEELDIRIYTAAEGETGYQMASDLLPDLVLLDVQMPILNGFVVCEMLRKKEETRNIPIILMSAVVDDESFERHSKLRYHADAYLQKPFMKSELHELVGRFTSLGDSKSADLESKTGFFLPSEEFSETSDGVQAEVTAPDPKTAEELETVRTQLLEMSEREAQLTSEVEAAQKDKDQLEAELFELRKTVQGDAGGLKDKLTIVTQRFEEAREESERLAKENSALQARIDEIPEGEDTAGKLSELEAKLAAAQEELNSSIAENQELAGKLQEAEASQELKDQITELGARLQESGAAALELENRNKLLEKDIAELKEKSAGDDASAPEESEREELLKEVDGLKRDLTAAIAAKEEIEDQARSLLEGGDKADETTTLKQDLESARSQNQELVSRLGDSEEKAMQLGEIEARLEAELSETARLRAQLEEAPEDLTGELSTLREDLAAALKRAESAEGEVSGLSEALREMENAEEKAAGLEKQVAELEVELEGSRTLAGEEIQARTDLEEKFNAVAEEKALLEKELDAAKKEQDEREDTDDRVSEASKTEQLAADFEKQVAQLKEELEDSRKLAARETQSRMDLEGKFDSQAEEKVLLEKELEEAKSKLDDREETDERFREVESRLEIEKQLSSDLEDEVKLLKSDLENKDSVDKQTARVEKENRQLKAELKDAQTRVEQLEKEAALLAELPDETTRGAVDTIHWDERFAELEDTLGKTVREAQNVLKEQKDRESALEDSVESLMRSLEEERTAYKNEREAWGSREGELKDAFEDALRESRRLMGEEAARLYPMHIPRHSKPLEVVSRVNRIGIAAAAAAAAILLFAGGYFLKSRPGPAYPVQATAPVPSQAARPEPQAATGGPPAPWIAASGPEETYEELWRKNTVQSISDDMMIQATIHTREELEAAIKYTAAKEGWTRERIQKAMADMARTYNLSGSFYITVYSKNLKSGYPGYADSFEQHIALRDHSGKEVRARLPGELEGSKFITSRVSAAGKEMNPVFLYEVGLTVAFPRKTLAADPEGLQLVLYDIGAVPMRVLTWDMSGLGSLS